MLKVLSVKNPWAWLIFQGKDIENRTRKTNYRGKLLIHASAKWDQLYHKGLSPGLSFDQWKTLDNKQQYHLASQTNMPVSAIIGEVQLVDCVKGHSSVWAEDNYWHWVLENPLLWTNPIPGVKGRLGIWNYEPYL